MFFLITNCSVVACKDLSHANSNFNHDHRAEVELGTQHKAVKVIPYINHLYNNNMNGVDVLDQ